MIFSLVAMTGLEKCCITSAYLQWLCHSGERPVARGPLVYNKDIYYRPATGGEKKTAQDMAEADVSAKLGMLSAKLSWVVEYPKNFNPNPVQVLMRHTIFTINIAPAKKEYQGNIFFIFLHENICFGTH